MGILSLSSFFLPKKIEGFYGRVLILGRKRLGILPYSDAEPISVSQMADSNSFRLNLKS
jgi:hypothetical protein